MIKKWMPQYQGKPMPPDEIDICPKCGGTGLRILVLELVVLQITNEKWADRIHFVQFNSEYGEKENIIKMERKI